VDREFSSFVREFIPYKVFVKTQRLSDKSAVRKRITAIDPDDRDLYGKDLNFLSIDVSIFRLL